MDRIPQETKATYDLLRADFEKADRVRVDNTVLAIAKLDAKFDLLSIRIDDVKVSVDIDIDEPRQGLDQSAPRPSNSLKRVPAFPIHGLSSGSNGSDSHRIDNENQGSGHKFYVPPPVRGGNSPSARIALPPLPLRAGRQPDHSSGVLPNGPPPSSPS
ncbi:hypothetical protein ZWY2020_018621 [Hordeum vulgare]|nr:hypothetical protein ZWY2020_018621 [Hordeum vulgare]